MLKTIGLRFRKVDILNFVSGIFLAVLLVLLVYMIVKQNMIIENNNFLTLLIDSKNKLIYYFIVALLEELIFRGLFLGLVLKKVNNIYVRLIVSALIFAVPHISNTDNISTIIMFIFPLLYGIVSAEMFVFSKSVWMSTGFHWLWNYSITSVFMKTGNLDLISIWIIVEMIILIPLLYCLFKKIGLDYNNRKRVMNYNLFGWRKKI